MKKSNKGFSLVELIIVIAIMAVLIAVLAPQYLQYVEKSKKQSDATAISEVVKAGEIAVAEPANGVVSGDEVVVSVSKAGAVSATQSKVKADVISACGSSIKLTSKFFTTDDSSVTFKMEGDNWTKTYAGPYADYLGE